MPKYACEYATEPTCIPATFTHFSFAFCCCSRGCYFSDERYLRFFKNYTFYNCRTECLSNYTYKECGCVMFYMPRIATMPICGYGKVQCVNIAKFGLKQKLNIKKIKDQDTCNCLPSCTDITYKTEVFYKPEKFNRANRVDNYMEIKLKQFAIVLTKRTEIYSFNDLIATIGGILGVFLGFSIISLAEIVFFSLISPFFFRNKSKKWKQTSIPKLSERKRITEIRKGKKRTTRNFTMLRRLTSKIMVFVSKYAESGTMPGIAFATGTKLHWIERTFWAIVMITTVCCSESFIYNVWSKWHQDPLIVSLSSESIDTNDVIFFSKF